MTSTLSQNREGNIKSGNNRIQNLKIKMNYDHTNQSIINKSVNFTEEFISDMNAQNTSKLEKYQQKINLLETKNNDLQLEVKELKNKNNPT